MESVELKAKKPDTGREACGTYFPADPMPDTDWLPQAFLEQVPGVRVDRGFPRRVP